MDSRTLGDYRLLEVVQETPYLTAWKAEQVSVSRAVLLVELTDLSQREAFLADVRAKAAVDHPLIGSVYEAVDDGTSCYIALEHVAGTSLSERLRAREAMKPADLAHILRRTAEAMMQLAAKGSATEPLGPSAIHFDRHGVVRLENTVRAGTADPQAATADIARLGKQLQPLVADGLPGASRILTVLAWMRGEGLDRSLTWDEVRSYGEQIEDQLREPAVTSPAPRTTRGKPPRPKWLVALPVAVGIVGVAVAAAILLRDDTPLPPAPKPALPEPVAVAAGTYPTPDGTEETLDAFVISAHEVTIGEYFQFLQMLDQLEAGKRDVFDHPKQPNEKIGHLPADWQTMVEAARAGGTWQGRPISLYHPVVNVDWWDASAYCKWKGGRLPTQEEWFAALRAKTEKPEALKPSDWSAVTDIGLDDRTPDGLRGLAGSVAEWTRLPAANPANPLGAKKSVILGGSFLKPAGGALAREWTDDRLLRRPDLGFRIIRDPE